MCFLSIILSFPPTDFIPKLFCQIVFIEMIGTSEKKNLKYKAKELLFLNKKPCAKQLKNLVFDAMFLFSNNKEVLG